MKEFKLFSYIRNYKWIIAVSSLLIGVLFYSYFSGRQTYTSSSIIQYRNEEAAEGLAPDGTEIDVTEIYSAEVIMKVFDKLGLNYDENNMDAIRAGVRVEPIQSEEEAAVQEALNEQGEVAEEQPTMYMVSYTVGSRDASNAADFSRQILGTMLNVYVETYAENHVNSEIPLYSVSGVYDKDYDYIEMLEILERSIRQALDQLAGKTDVDFRSSDTGYSFSDLRREFSLLKNIELPNTYAYVLGNQVTKDQDTLISKYENRVKSAGLQNDASSSKSVGIEEIINAYVAMMRGSNNTDFTKDYILDDVYENYYGEEENGERQDVDTTTEYDNLMNRYVSERTDFEGTLIDIAYSRYILDVFSGTLDVGNDVTVHIAEDPGTGSGENAAGQTEGEDVETVTFDTDTVIKTEIVSSDESQEQAYGMIRELTDKVDALYQDALLTNHEYNRFAGAQNIAIMTDTVTQPALNLLIYAIFAVVLFGMVGCVFAVAAGRTFEILEYYVFTDKKLNIANRAGCDRYISRYGKKMLPPDFVCITVKMADIGEKNKKYGRERCDKMMADFCGILQEVFPMEKTYIANNSLGQFVCFLEDSDKQQAHAYVHEVGRLCMAYNKEHECKVSYACGISASGGNQIYDIRKLMIDSINKTSGEVIRKIS